MVTRIVVRITRPAERASAAEDLNRDDGNDQLHHKKRDDDFDDDYHKYDTKEGGEEIQLCNSTGRLSKAADEGFCDGHSHNVSSLCKSNDDAIDEGTAGEISRHDGNTSKKRPLLLKDDADDNGKNKRGRKRQNFIDLTDVPPQSPIKSKRMDSSSKYQGVSFNKSAKKWQATISVDGKQHCIGSYDNEEEAAIDYAPVFKYKAGIAGGERKQNMIDLTDVPSQSPIKSSRSEGSSKYQGVCFDKTKNKWKAIIMIDGKQHCIGSYDSEEEAAIDYARAVFKYSAEITQKGGPSAKHTDVQREVCSSVAGTNQTYYGRVCRHHKPNNHKQKGGCTNDMPVTDISSCSIDLVNKGGRIGIYLPDERKARIARFHAKRSTRVFKRRVSYHARKSVADSRPRIKGRFVVQKSNVGGEDST